MKAVLAFAAIALAQGALLQAAPAISGWTPLGRAPAAQEITVNIALKKDMTGVSRHLEAAATPGSPHFRQWATHGQAIRLRPTASPDAVLAHLKKAGVEASVVGDSVVAKMTVKQVEETFGTVVEHYKSATTGETWHRAGHLHAPEGVASAVAAVYGLHGFPLPPKKSHIHGKDGVPEAIIPVGPTQIRSAYGVDKRGSGTTRARQAVAEFQGQFANSNDLATFFREYVPNAQPGDDKVYAYKGNQGSGFGVEALLDIEYIMGIAPGVKTEFWGWKNFDFCSDLKNWTQTILSDTAPPLVFSISYGWQGDLGQIGCEQSQVQDIDNDLKSIAGRGISIIFASGDSGAQEQGGKLWPSWPASSPWVTAVGATCFTDQSMTEQMASTQFGSGSGFSSMFTAPSYQQSAVNSYLSGQSNLPPASYWSRGGRATADVSALGEGYNTVINGRTEPVGGTSAATPCFAGIISLINDDLITAGKSPLGFLNPWVYNNTGMFTDVTKGSDKIGRGGQPFQYGFNCAAGWDPATGLGVPNFARMK